METMSVALVLHISINHQYQSINQSIVCPLHSVKTQTLRRAESAGMALTGFTLRLTDISDMLVLVEDQPYLTLMLSVSSHILKIS